MRMMKKMTLLQLALGSPREAQKLISEVSRFFNQHGYMTRCPNDIEVQWLVDSLRRKHEVDEGFKKMRRYYRPRRQPKKGAGRPAVP